MKKIISKILMIAILIVIPMIIVGCGENPGPTISSIEIVRVEKRKGYKIGDKFDETNMVIRANYSDGSFKNITSGWQIKYISIKGNYLHDDYFYAGENRIRIEYEGQYYIMSLYDDVQKIENEHRIEIEEYSHIYTGERIKFPLENIKVYNSENQLVSGAIELVYCTSFESFDNYQTTTLAHGAESNGKAPLKAGTYKVFAKLLGGQNYNDLLSEVVEFNIFDETKIGLFANQDEEYFGWKEVTPFDNVYDYIEFFIDNENNKKVLKYNSNFAGSGSAVVFSDHITLTNETQKVQILLKNGKIYTNNGQNILDKWQKPAYLGNYEMIISAEKANELKYETNEDFVCELKIFIDETNHNGEVKFTLKCLSEQTDQISVVSNFEGVVGFNNFNKSLTFITNGLGEIFAYNINKNNIPEKITLTFDDASSSKISAGEYIRK